MNHADLCDAENAVELVSRDALLAEAKQVRRLWHPGAGSRSGRVVVGPRTMPAAVNGRPSGGIGSALACSGAVRSAIVYKLGRRGVDPSASQRCETARDKAVLSGCGAMR